MGAARKQTPAEAAEVLERNGLRISDGGRKTPSLQVALKRYLRENPEYLEQIIMGMVHKARMGDHRVLEMLFDRLDGAVVKKAVVETEHHIKRYGFAEPPRLVEPEPHED